jgi:hypothetical protein
MSASKHTSVISENQSELPVVYISYECVLKERGRESSSYLYEVACSITYPATTAHLSLRVTGQNTYRNVAAREVPFTLHEAGATTYIELQEAERLEVRIVEYGGRYCKAFYYAHGRELIEQDARQVVSTIRRIDTRADDK